MREREEVFDHFITAVINTLNADEIYDAAIEALQDILQPDGLLLMMNQNTHHVFSVIRKCGSIACTKSYSVPTDSMLQELKDSPNMIMLNDTGKHILDLLTPRQRNWLNAEHITAIYTLKYNQVIIGFLYIATHDGQDFAPEELRYLEKYVTIPPMRCAMPTCIRMHTAHLLPMTLLLCTTANTHLNVLTMYASIRSHPH